MCYNYCVKWGLSLSACRSVGLSCCGLGGRTVLLLAVAVIDSFLFNCFFLHVRPFCVLFLVSFSVALFFFYCGLVPVNVLHALPCWYPRLPWRYLCTIPTPPLSSPPRFFFFGFLFFGVFPSI